MFRPASDSTPRKSSFAQRRGTLRSVAFLLSLALAALMVGRPNMLVLHHSAVDQPSLSAETCPPRRATS
jgi:hypothetical protein